MVFACNAFLPHKHVITRQKRKAKSQKINDDADDDLGLDEEPVESNISGSESETLD